METATAVATATPVRYRAGKGAGLVPGRYTADLIGLEPGISHAGKDKLVVTCRISAGGVAIGKLTDHLSLCGSPRTDQFFAAALGLQAGQELDVLNADRTLTDSVKAAFGRSFAVDIELRQSETKPGKAYPSVTRYLVSDGHHVPPAKPTA